MSGQSLAFASVAVALVLFAGAASAKPLKEPSSSLCTANKQALLPYVNETTFYECIQNEDGGFDVRASPYTGTIVVYNAAGGSGTIVCTLFYGLDYTWNFKLGEGGCQNDVARSMSIQAATQYTVIQIFDGLYGDMNYSWATVKVKQAITGATVISSFETTTSQTAYDQLYYSRSGSALNGGVSFFKVNAFT